jgi:hypothetical protein
MNCGKTIFSQLMEFLSPYEFRRCVQRYNGNYKIKSFSCWDQFLCMAFAQLTYRESLRDIQVCLRAAQTKLFPWAQFRKRKAAVKLHTLLDLRGNIPIVVIVTSGKVNDVRMLDQLSIESGAFYILDRGYIDFNRLHSLHLASGILCNPGQEQLPLPAPVFSAGAQRGRTLRPNRYPLETSMPSAIIAQSFGASGMSIRKPRSRWCF